MSIRMIGRCWDLSQASGARLLTLIAISDIANDEGYAWPSHDTLAQRARVSVSSVQRHIRALVDAGELEVVRQGNGRVSAKYRVVLGHKIEGSQNDHPQPSETPTQGSQNDHPGWSECTPRVVTAMTTQGGHSCDHRTVKEPSRTPTTPAAPGAVWDSMVKVHGFEPKSPAEVKRWRRTATELARLGASGEEYERRAGAYQHAHPTWAFTPKAILGRWGELDITAAPAGEPLERRLLRWAAGAATKFDPETFEGLLEEHYSSASAELLDQARTTYQETRLAA